jgi:hypothetical protein
MTRIKILRTFRIALDGITVQTWQPGMERDVDDSTLALLIDQGACEIVTKAHEAAPENKATRKRKAKT